MIRRIDQELRGELGKPHHWGVEIKWWGKRNKKDLKKEPQNYNIFIFLYFIIYFIFFSFKFIPLDVETGLTPQTKKAFSQAHSIV